MKRATLRPAVVACGAEVDGVGVVGVDVGEGADRGSTDGVGDGGGGGVRATDVVAPAAGGEADVGGATGFAGG